VPSPHRFRKLDGFDWLTRLAASVAGGCAWLFGPLLVGELLYPRKALPPGPPQPGWVLVTMMLAAFAASIVIHEGGHWLAARRLHIPATQIRVGFFRAAVELDADLSRTEELWITLAGPAVNLAAFLLILALPWMPNRWWADLWLAFAMANAGTGVLNLMPFRFDEHTVSDGERILALLFEK